MALLMDIGNTSIEWVTAVEWHLRLRTDVMRIELRPPHRVLLAFSPTAGGYFSDKLATHGSERQYSEGFTALTGDSYLFIRARGDGIDGPLFGNDCRQSRV